MSRPSSVSSPLTRRHPRYEPAAAPAARFSGSGRGRRHAGPSSRPGTRSTVRPGKKKKKKRRRRNMKISPRCALTDVTVLGRCLASFFCLSAVPSPSRPDARGCGGSSSVSREGRAALEEGEVAPGPASCEVTCGLLRCASLCLEGGAV